MALLAFGILAAHFHGILGVDVEGDFIVGDALVGKLPDQMAGDRAAVAARGDLVGRHPSRRVGGRLGRHPDRWAARGPARITGLLPATTRALARLVISSAGSLPARSTATSLSSAIALSHAEVGEKGQIMS